MIGDPRTSPRTALRALLVRYVTAIDAQTLEMLRHVFIVDCRVRFGDVAIEGIDALLIHLEKTLARFRETKHIISDIAGETYGRDLDAPTFRANVTAWHAFYQDRPSLTLFGFYDDTLVWTDAGWRISDHIGGEYSRAHGTARPAKPS
ncbi:MAG: hypothetical protein CL931_12805 [Deltaproteobacteria bacterium]|nr:hypothetical protein [Deltaproteobacteria bacterium]